MADKKIYCSVYDCVHNKQEICDVNALNVSGSYAENTDETFCASFDAGNTIESCVSSKPLDNCDSIDCDVTSCAHNENMACSLNEIKVDYEDGCTSCQTALNTCCGSFDNE